MQAHLPKDGTAYSRLGPLTSINNWKDDPQSWADEDNLQLRFSLLSCAKLTTKSNPHISYVWKQTLCTLAS